MKKFSTKDFKLKNHFVLYSQSESEVYYFDTFEELLKYIKYNLCDIVHLFNRYSIDDTINIVVDKEKYQLYTFTD